MCGICGLIDLDGQSKLDLKGTVGKMTARLVHRGPDAKGFWHDTGVALGHRRLSIIDLPGSIQPMQDTTGRYTMVFNGEIYNYVELRTDLEKQGMRFRTNGDTEVLLVEYIAYGEACLEHLNGMFAFAVWDKREQVLFAARDRMGVKPFFYGKGRSGLVAFASEIQAMRGLPLDFSISPKALAQYLRHGFIRSPDTIFQGVRELRPAHFLRHSRKGIEVRQYWQPPLPCHPTQGKRPVCELAEELRDIVKSAVRIRLRSDVPLGAFLSGGLDSSIVVASMKDLGQTAVHTFSIGFKEASFDEGPYARDVAGFFDTIHYEARAALEAGDLLFDLVRHYGQPYGDSSAIPMWRLCQKTREHVTVALSGDGADELFCGYRRYVARRLLGYYRYLPKLIRQKILPPLVARLREGTAYYDQSLIKKIRLFVALDKRTAIDRKDIYPACFTVEDLDRLLDAGAVAQGRESGNRFDEMLAKQVNEIEFMMISDMLHYLPDDILTKVDRAGMAHGLEVRSPFMDYRVVEFACRLPLCHKLRGLTTKYILRKAFLRDLPPIPLKRKKHGFSVPLGDWFQGPLREIYHDLALSGSGSSFVKASEAERLIKEHQTGRVDHGHRLWLILFLHAWDQWWKQG
jgi:asparagine synthase (glutamine-hydrolysing)